MDSNVSSRSFGLFRDYIERQSGIVLGEDKAYLIESRLARILAERGFKSFEDLYLRIYSEHDRELSARVIDALTTNETLWFRDGSPWQILEELLMPEYINRLRSGAARSIRIWSAACSTGQEPYSTAMCIDRYLRERAIRDVSPEQFEIIASDLSSSVLELAAMGRYDSLSIIRGLPDVYKKQYFTSAGHTWTLSPDIVRRVKFLRLNLKDSFMHLGRLDLIFCRYVLIYFSDSLKDELLKKFHQSLNREGTLFLGGAEVLTNGRQLFKQREHGSGVYYQGVY